MAIFGVILLQNELKMGHFPLKLVVVVKYGTFLVQNMVHNNSHILDPSNSCLESATIL